MFTGALFSWRLRMMLLAVALVLLAVTAAWYVLPVQMTSWESFLVVATGLVVVAVVVGLAFAGQLARDLREIGQQMEGLAGQWLQTGPVPAGSGRPEPTWRRGPGGRQGELAAIEDSLSRLGQQLGELQQASFELAQVDLPQRVMQRSIAALMRVTGAPKAFIALLDTADPSVVVVQQAEGYDLSGVRGSLSDPGLAQVFRQRVPRIVRDTTLQPDSFLSRRQARVERVRSGLYACLSSRSGPIGVCGVHHTHPDWFTSQDAAVLAALASQISVALQNAHSHAGLQAAVVTDPLTGVFNRRFLEVDALPLLGRGPAGLLMVDVDRFKEVNDSLGHDAGDRVLRHVARLLAHCTRTRDRIVRFGGDEFLVLLPGLTRAGAEAVAERIRQAVSSTPLTVAGGETAVTVSVGVAEWKPDGADASPKLLLTSADAALQAAKAAGRNRVAVYG